MTSFITVIGFKSRTALVCLVRSSQAKSDSIRTIIPINTRTTYTLICKKLLTRTATHCWISISQCHIFIYYCYYYYYFFFLFFFLAAPNQTKAYLTFSFMFLLLFRFGHENTDNNITEHICTNYALQARATCASSDTYLPISTSGYPLHHVSS